MTSRPNPTASCAITCKQRWFQNYLVQNRGLDLPKNLSEGEREARTAVKVRGICKITTRRHLNTNKDAALIWKHLRRDAWQWKEGQ